VAEDKDICPSDRGVDAAGKRHRGAAVDRAVCHGQIDVGKAVFHAAGERRFLLGDEHRVVEPLLRTVSAADHGNVGIAGGVAGQVSVAAGIDARTDDRLPESGILRRHALLRARSRGDNVIRTADDPDGSPAIGQNARV
jgi:hypothetical protein